MARRQQYSEKDSRVLGARVKVSHPKLGVKVVELSDDPKQPFRIAVRSLSLGMAKKAVHKVLRYERGSKVKLAIKTADSETEGFDIREANQLIDFLIKWDGDYNKRLEAFIEGLISACTKTFNSGINQEATACLKAILNIYSLAEDVMNHAMLLDKQLLSGLVGMCESKSFSVCTEAARLTKYLLEHTNASVRTLLLENGVLSGLFQTTKDAKFTRKDDEIHTIHAVAGILHELELHGCEKFLEYADPVTANSGIIVLLDFILRCKREDTLEIACACACHLLPFADSDDLIHFGLKMIEHADFRVCATAIYALALASSTGGGRVALVRSGGNELANRLGRFGKQILDRDTIREEDLGTFMQTVQEHHSKRHSSARHVSKQPSVLKISRESKPVKMVNVQGILRPMNALHSPKVSKQALQVLSQLVSRALWGFASALVPGPGESSTAPRNNDVVDTGVLVDDSVVSLLISLSKSDDPLIAVGSTGSLANLASAEKLSGQDICFGLIDQMRAASTPIVAEYLAAAISSILAQRRSPLPQTKPLKSSNDDHIFKHLVLMIETRARHKVELTAQIHLASGILNLSRPHIETDKRYSFLHMQTSTPSRKAASIIVFLKLLKYKASLHPQVLNFLLCAFWAMGINPQNANLLGKVGAVELVVRVYKSLRKKLNVGEPSESNGVTVGVLIQRVLGVLFVLVFAESNQVRIADQRCLRILHDAIKTNENKIIATAIAIVWKLAENNTCAASLVSHQFVPTLLEITKKSSLPPKCRKHTANVLEVLSLSPTLQRSFVPKSKLESTDETMIEMMLIRLLRDNNFELNAYAGRSLAKLAMSQRQHVILKLRGIQHLLQVVQRAANQSPPVMFSDAALDNALMALRNLSVFQKHQQVIAKCGLEMLMNVAVLTKRQTARDEIQAILHNISKNPRNRTHIYKIQLQSQTSKFRHEFEKSTRKVLEWKANSAVYKRLIESSGACEVQSQTNIKNAKTTYDIMRIKNAEASWIPTPQAAHLLISIEDKHRLAKRQTLSSLMQQPVKKMWAEGHKSNPKAKQERKRTAAIRHKNIWEPDVVAYKYDSALLMPHVIDNYKDQIDKHGRIRVDSPQYTKPQTSPMRRKEPHSRSAPVLRPSSAAVLSKQTLSATASITSANADSRRPGTAPTGETLGFGGQPRKHSRLGRNVIPRRSSRAPFDIMLEPECSHYNRISFGKLSKPNFKPMDQTVEFPGVKLAKFRYVPGNKISPNLFSHYALPDGQFTHYYCRSELEQAVDPGSTATVPLPFTRSKIFPGFDEETSEPLPIPLKPNSPSSEENVSKFLSHASMNYECKEKKAPNIIFVDPLPTLLTDEVKVTHISEAAKRHVWTLDESIFNPRKRLSDARDFYDNKKVKKSAFKIDWNNLTSKKRFVNFILREDDDGSKDELYEVRDVIWECYDTIMDAYEFYSVMGTSMSSLYTISLNSYSDFVDDCNIPDSKSKTCKRKDLDTIFIVANVEEDKASKVNKQNDDRALMRFEFLEVVVRIAIQKYLRSGDTDDVSDAVRMLCEQNIRPSLGPEAVHDSNVFRKNRLYTEGVDKVFKQHNKRIQMIFKVFAQPKVGFTKYQLMNMEEWMYLLKTCELFDEDFTQREGKLAFAWAQMAIADEIRRRVAFTCITFEDFLEALARICDMKALPTDEDIKKTGVKTAGKFFEKKKEEGLLDDFCRANPCHWHDKKTRSMHELLPKLLDLIFTKLDRDGDGDFDFSDLQKWVSQGRGSR